MLPIAISNGEKEGTMKIKARCIASAAALAAAMSAMTLGAAATGDVSITVDPTVRIRVNGQDFQPKNVLGEDVAVFVYNGTTYAPLRALAEAYGLQVGWDADLGMATVDGASAPQPAPAQEQEAQPVSAAYIGNSNTGKFHRAGCRMIGSMNEEHKVPVATREEAIAGGYDPCGICKP